MLLLGFCALLSLLAAFRIKAFISDDVIYQVLARDISTRSHPVYIGIDTFIIKTWLYAFLHGHTIESLYLTGGLLFAGTFGLFSVLYAKSTGFVPHYASTHYLAVPLLWLLSIGYFLGAVIIAPNSRNIEIGLGYLVLVYVVGSFIRPFSITRFGILIAASCLLAINDPYFVYLFLIPLMIWSLLATWRARTRHWYAMVSVIALCTASFLSVYVGKATFSKFNILVINNAPYTFSTLADIPNRFSLLLASFANILGIDFLGYRVLSFIDLVGYAGLAVAATLTLNGLARKHGNHKTEPLVTLLVAQILLASGVYLFTTASQGLGTARYLVVVPFAAALLLGKLLIIAPKRLRLVLVYCLFTIIASNLARSLLISIQPTSSPATRSIVTSSAFNNPVGEPAADNIGNAENIRIADIVAASGIRKGYANYWQGAINAYFMPNTLVINIVCEEKMAPQYFLVNTSSYYLSVDRSFFITYKNDADCTYLANRLGAVHTYETKWYRIFFFNYDVGRQLKDYPANR